MKKSMQGIEQRTCGRGSDMKQISRTMMWLSAALLGLFLLMGASMNADAGLFGGTGWKEEVLLHDGSKIIVKRSQNRGGRHEIGQSPPVKEHDITFTLPGSNQSVTWKDEYSEDVGHSNFDLLALHILNGTPYLVASPFGCLSYNKWGRPNPPYVIFKYDGKAWNRISMAEFPAEFQTLNLVQDTDNNEKRLIALGLVSAEQVKSFNRNYPQPEFKTILREPVENYGKSCGEMVYDGNGGWIGIGWFRKQPSYEACLKYCELERVSAQYCPCESLFKGK